MRGLSSPGVNILGPVVDFVSKESAGGFLDADREASGRVWRLGSGLMRDGVVRSPCRGVGFRTDWFTSVTGFGLPECVGEGSSAMSDRGRQARYLIQRSRHDWAVCRLFCDESARLESTVHG